MKNDRTTIAKNLLIRTLNYRGENINEEKELEEWIRSHKATMYNQFIEIMATIFNRTSQFKFKSTKDRLTFRRYILYDIENYIKDVLNLKRFSYGQERLL